MTDGSGGDGRVAVCATDELRPGDRLLVAVDDVTVVVLNADGDYYAVESECAHQGGPVGRGRVRYEPVDESESPDEGAFDRRGKRPVIDCPWHGWTYDLVTGEHYGVGDASLRTFDVNVDGGTVYLER